MSTRHVIRLAPLGLVLAAAACSSDDRPAPAADEATGSGASPGTAGGPGQDGTSGNEGGASSELAGGAGAGNGEGAAAGSAGATWGVCGPLPYGPCGDGVLHCEEECDTDVFFLESCADYGFETGSLACRADCTVDTSGCSGTERCDDGVDNDGDGQVDCIDPDCAAQCADSCDSPLPLGDPDSVSGSTVSQPDSTDPSCVISGSGPEVVYQLVAANTGSLAVTLETYSCLVVSARTACSDPTTELACAVGASPDAAATPTISVPVTAGETIYVIVEGCDPTFAGDFTLTVSSSAP